MDSKDPTKTPPTEARLESDGERLYDTLVFTELCQRRVVWDRRPDSKGAVIYNKIWEIATTNSLWKISLVIDLYVYEELTNKFLANINNIAKIMEWANKQYQSPQRVQYKKHFEDLEKEIKFLNQTRKGIHDNLQGYENLKRKRQSVIPIVGNKMCQTVQTADSTVTSDERELTMTEETNDLTTEGVTEPTVTVTNELTDEPTLTEETYELTIT